MKSFIAGSLALMFHTIGFAIGCGLWALVGYCLGSALCHAPVSGALSGLAFQLGCYVMAHEQMWAGIQRAHQKFLVVLDRAIA